MKTNKLKEMGGRFTMHVWPGETLSVKTWKANDSLENQSG